MIWIVLAALGIPLWMIAGALAATLWSRRRFKAAPGVFAAKVRCVSGDVAGLKATWPRRPLYARWVHDVLIVQRGLALVRNDSLGVAQASGSLTSSEPDGIRGLGQHPVLLTLILDGGACIQLAAGADERHTVVGPFETLVAASSADSAID